jgi:hypothetical protein
MRLIQGEETIRQLTPISAAGKSTDVFSVARAEPHRALPVGELDAITFQPGDGRAALVKGGFP